MTVGSLFSGIGGLDLGLERAGMEIRWQVEIDEFCQRVLEKHWPGVKRYGDIRELQGTELEPVDLICGGFPCQPHSLAGKRKGSQDERDLWSEFARIVREVKPRWILAENVPGLLSSENGRFFGRVLRDLAESGYDAEWSLLSACAMGAPHTRERVFIVAYANSINDPDKTREKSEIQSGTWWAQFSRTTWWISEPSLGRVAHGIPNRMDRLRALGNAVVPQIAEWIGRRIMEAEMRKEV